LDETEGWEILGRRKKMTLERRVKKLEQVIDPPAEEETIHVKIGKGYYEPTSGELGG